MARKKQEDPPKGSPAWMATFSDLMNLLLCFFVLLFSMSTVSEEKLEMVIQSLHEAFSIMPSGGNTLQDEGVLISSGVSALEQFDVYFDTSTPAEEEENDPAGEQDEENQGETGEENGETSGEQDEDNEMTAEEAKEQAEADALAESEETAEVIERELLDYGIQDEVEVTFNGQYILLTLNGALLFDSGQAEVKEAALPLLDKLGNILETYPSNLIQVEGHTDNVPQSSAKYESNDVLSMYRALYVADYLRSITNIEPSHIVSAGRGEYYPIADNATAEGRALNRRVEIKIFNSYNSGDLP